MNTFTVVMNHLTDALMGGAFVIAGAICLAAATDLVSVVLALFKKDGIKQWAQKRRWYQ